MTNPSNAPASSPAPRLYKILVAVAFDPSDHAAISQGMQIASRSQGSELHVVHAVTGPLDPGSGASAASAAFDKASEWMRTRVEEAWQQAGEIEVIAHIRFGDASDVILQAAIDVDADLVVVGSRRNTGIRKLVLGSVAERVLHHAHCPVLVAVPKDYAGTTASARVDPPCPECLAVRKQSGNATFWCERHSRPYMQPHIYVPRDDNRSSLMPTY